MKFDTRNFRRTVYELVCDANFILVNNQQSANWLLCPCHRFTYKSCCRKKSLKMKAHDANLVMLWYHQQNACRTASTNNTCRHPDSLTQGKEQADKTMSRLRKSLQECRQQGCWSLGFGFGYWRCCGFRWIWFWWILECWSSHHVFVSLSFITAHVY